MCKCNPSIKGPWCENCKTIELPKVNQECIECKKLADKLVEITELKFQIKQLNEQLVNYSLLLRLTKEKLEELS